jgi:hypothetical protein
MNQSIKTPAHIVEFSKDFQNNMTGPDKTVVIPENKAVWEI